MTPAEAVLVEVAAERARQDERWGEQNHADGTGRTPETLHDIYLCMSREPVGMTELARVARRATDEAAAAASVTWAHILLEEVFEALAEDDPDRLRTELLQVAAVATQWVEAIDRRAAADGASPAPVEPPC